MRSRDQVVEDIRATFGDRILPGTLVSEAVKDGRGQVVAYVVRLADVSFNARISSREHTIYLRPPLPPPDGGGGPQ